MGCWMRRFDKLEQVDPITSALEALTGYKVVPFRPGAVAASAGASDGGITVRRGHGFYVGTEKCALYRPSTNALVANPSGDTLFSMSVVSATSVTFAAASGAVTVVIDDIIINLNTDTGGTAPNFLSSPISITTDPAGAGTPITNSTVTSSSNPPYGEYEYYVQSPFIWELVHNNGTFVKLIPFPTLGSPILYAEHDMTLNTSGANPNEPFITMNTFNGTGTWNIFMDLSGYLEVKEANSSKVALRLIDGASTSRVQVGDGTATINGGVTPSLAVVSAADETSLVVQGAAGQTASLFRLQDSAGTSLFNVSVAGTISKGSGSFTISNAVAVTGTISATGALFPYSALGPGVYVNAGDPNGSLSAPKGSICLNTTGSSTSTRMYVNNSAGTGTVWVAFTTAS